MGDTNDGSTKRSATVLADFGYLLFLAIIYLSARAFFPKKGISLLAFVVLLNCSLLDGTGAADQQEGQGITIGEKFTLHSRILNEDRPYWVYLPSSYQDATFAPERYPVLYLLDGDDYFFTASGMVEYMSDDPGQIPELIVVAIPNVHGHRTRDLTVSHTLKDYDGREAPGFASSGGADAFLKFLKEELIPQIDSHYRTAPYRIIMGHSFGGVFVVNAFLEQPSLFQAYLAIDPSLWWDDEILIRKAKNAFPGMTGLHASFYSCMANHSYLKATGVDSTNWDTSLVEFAALLKTNASPQLRSEFQRFDSEDHDSVPLMGIYEGLRFTFDGYEPSAFAAFNPVTLSEQFSEISKRLGFKFLPPEQYVDGRGYQMLTERTYDLDKAVGFFKLNTMNYPLSFHAYDSLAHAYVIEGDKGSAIKNYKKAFELNPKDQNAVIQLKKLRQQ